MTGPPLRQVLVFRNPNPSAGGALLELSPSPVEGSAAWSLSVRDAENLAHCIGDYASQQAALEVLKLLFGELTPIPDPITRCK